MIITIDGPTASGKSTLASSLAKKLNLFHLNSGYLYRSVAYILVNYFNYDEQKLQKPKIDEIKQILNESHFKYLFENNNVKITYNNLDITPFLKTSEMDNYSSIVSAISYVRDAIHNFQRKIAITNDIVMEGRDCGSIVFPNADFKFFLTAPLQVRAERWQNDQKVKGKNYSLAQAIQIVQERDERDLKRAISPLIIPKNAVVIDDGNLSSDQLLKKVLQIIKPE